jgi:predicted MPP superfamily phosphohydrolase
MSDNLVRIAVISDLHYLNYGQEGSRPAVAQQGTYSDPMEGLLCLLQEQASPVRADYLLCPGDITDRANSEAFTQGWERLKQLQLALRASHLIATTGNHEVDSRAGDQHDRPGSVEVEADPLKMLQGLRDYPSTAIDGDRRWVYWGRGYEFIEGDGVLFLVINSSHYHWTTRANEFERGRVGDVALAVLREEIAERVALDRNRAFVVLLHHHPIPHQDLDHQLGRIEMANGPRLMQLLEESGVAWIVVHGHKHHARLITAQGGPARPIVFSAGSFGARLDGSLGLKTRTQFYIVNLHVEDQAIAPKNCGTVHAWAWCDNEWIPATRYVHGLPDGCGFRLPQLDIEQLGRAVLALVSNRGPYLSWKEAVQELPDLGFLMPSELTLLKKVFVSLGVKATWAHDRWFPTEVSK